MARQRNPPQRFSRSPHRQRRVGKRRNAQNAQPALSPSKHKKGPVSDKPSLVRATLQKALAKKPIATPLTDSDDSDRLVTKRKNVGKVSNPIYASGGVAQGDTPGAHPSRKRKGMDDHAEDRPSPEKRRQIEPVSGLKRPSKSSLRSPLAPLASNVSTTSSPANMRTSSPAAPLSLAGSNAQPYLSNSILPAAETSIIGTLKPRKRQPSILQIIETNDSSGFTPDDENEFLPDDVSTHLHVTKSLLLTTTPGSSLRHSNQHNSNSVGLRRPNSASEQENPTRSPGAMDATPALSSPVLPELRHNKLAKQKAARPAEEDSVMALPASSSSPLASPPQPVSTLKSRKAGNKLITTAAPQNRVASQSQRPQRRRKQTQNTFNISEDSQGSQSQLDGPSGESDNTPFKPQRRKAAARPKKAGTAISSSKIPSTSTARSSRRTTSILSDATNRSKNVRGAASLKAGGNKGSRTDTKEKQSGGARHFGTISTGKGKGAASVDKENMPLPAGGEAADELERIRSKFAEIDGWDMDFEDVEVDSEDARREVDMR